MTTQAQQNGWTPERVETLRKLWSDGLSGAVIAGILADVTRVAVIAKARRMGLARRRTQQRVSRRALPSTPNGKRILPGSAISHPKKPAVKAKAATAVFQTLPLPQETAPLPEALFISLIDLGPDQCKWPHGDPREAGFGFCGAERSKGPYCAHHASKAFNASSNHRPKAIVGMAA